MNRQALRVSIGLPVYNGEQYLAKALDSLLAQTFTDFEVIISDNASTDRTSEICAAYLERDPRIRYYRNQQNIGAAPNFNRTFELATGMYFKTCSYSLNRSLPDQSLIGLIEKQNLLDLYGLY